MVPLNTPGKHTVYDNYGNIANRVSLRVDNGPAMVFDANETVAESESVGSPCGAEKLGRFHADIAATARQDFTNGKHEVG